LLKRSCLILFGTAAAVVVLALPGVARAGWSWNESGSASADGWTWSGDSAASTDGWSWGGDGTEAVPASSG
jgi:hypothetical protein